MYEIFAKIIAFFMSILAFFGLVKPNNGPERFDGAYKITVAEQKIEFQLDANSTTGYKWGYYVEGDAIEKTADKYQEYDHEPGMTGVGGVQFYDFEAVKPGTVKVTFNYARSWQEGNAKVIAFNVTVDDNMTVTWEEAE